MKQGKKKSGGIWDMQFVTASISTTFVLILLGTVVFFVLSAHNLSVYVREYINFSILLSDDMREADMLRFRKDLDGKRYVKESIFISKEQALQEQTEAMGYDPAEFVGHNPFTASIEIKLHSPYANADSLAWIEKEIRDNKYVTDVVYPEELMNAVNESIQKISLVLLALAALLTLVSFALINNTVRLTIYSKRFLIHTMKLVGASWGFIRRPFMVRNLWIGIISGMVADAVLLGAAYQLVRYEPDLIAVVTPDVLLYMALTVLLFGIVITWLCGYVSINKYLRMRASTLYYI